MSRGRWCHVRSGGAPMASAEVSAEVLSCASSSPRSRQVVSAAYDTASRLQLPPARDQAPESTVGQPMA
eukprot:20635-Pyramimonas_sp.AAC.1